MTDPHHRATDDASGQAITRDPRRSLGDADQVSAPAAIAPVHPLPRVPSALRPTHAERQTVFMSGSTADLLLTKASIMFPAVQFVDWRTRTRRSSLHRRHGARPTR